MSLDTKPILSVKHVLIVDRSQTDNISLIIIQRVRQTPKAPNHTHAQRRSP